MQPQAWMTAADTSAVVAALTAEGADVRFVGGCVRDALLGRSVRDVDLATPDVPQTVIGLLDRAGIKAVPTGIDHGTVTAIVNGKSFEITTLRRDVETFGRHARVAFTRDWRQDAARRDFTINALSCSPDGILFDPYGGIADLQAGRVRFVEDARRRIEEDHLRLLRFFRFHAHYGRGAPDPEGLEAARDLAPTLKSLSRERVRDELMKLLAATDPLPVVQVMLEEGILQHVLPEARDTAVLRAFIGVEPRGCEPDPLLRLSALTTLDRSLAEEVAGRLRLSRAQRERLVDLAQPKVQARVDMDARSLRRAMYHLGKARVRDLVLLDWARRQGGDRAPDRAALTKALAAIDRWKPVLFPLKGRDATALGVPPGPDVGRLLAEAEAWWIERDFRPSRKGCMDRLRALILAGSSKD